MKKIAIMCMILTMSMGLMACGNKTEVSTSEETMVEESSDSGMESVSTEAERISIESTEDAEESITAEHTVFEDNFAVDQKTVAVFGVKIKEAVAAKDIDKLAELVSFPTYVGFGEGIVVETKEDFLSLDTEKLFTQEMLTSIEGADEKVLTASKAGFTLQTEGVSPSITYSIVEGELGIVGINY